MNEWYSLIKSKASTCAFGANLTDIVKDKFITGLKAGSIRDRLAEEDESLKLEKALSIAVNKEVIMKSSTREINKLNLCKKSNQSEAQSSRSFNNNCKSESKSFSEHQSSSKFACYRCGKSNHNASNCFYKRYKCSVCKELGHLKIMCKKNNNKNVNYLESENTDGEICNCVYDLNMMSLSSTVNHHIEDKIESAVDDAVFDNNDKVKTVIELNNIYVSDIANPIKVSVSIGDKLFNMEVDTGAGVSVIPADTYKQHLSCYQLLPTPLMFKGYTGQMIQPLGKINCDLVYEGTRKKMDFHIVEGGKSLLLARDIRYLR